MNSIVVFTFDTKSMCYRHVADGGYGWAMPPNEKKRHEFPRQDCSPGVAEKLSFKE